MTNPSCGTCFNLLAEISKAFDRMTFEEKAAWRFKVLMQYPETRRRLLN
jgi:hypothetical protein